MARSLQPLVNRVAAYAVLLLFTAGVTPAQVLNGNGGFEAFDLGAPSNTQEWFFQISDPSLVDLLIVDSPVFEGDRALSATVNATGDNLQFSNQNIDVTGAGAGTYRYTAWARASEDGAQLMAIGDHHGGSFTWFGNETFPLTTEWTELTFEFEVPEEVEGVPVDLIRATHVLNFAENVGKTVYVDEVQVTKVEEGGMTIAEARAAGAGATVTVQGVVTRAKGAFTYIQDETAGLAIRQTSGAFFDDVASGAIAAGTEILVTGTLSEFAGLLQVNGADLDSYEVVGVAAVPAPQVVTLEEIVANGEAYEAELVRVNDLTTDATGTFAAATSYQITDGTATDTLRVPNADDSDVDGTAIPEGEFTFAGVLGQFSFDDPGFGYQLLAIEETDVEEEPGDGNLVTNGSFEDTELGVVTDLSGGVEGWVLEVGSSVTTDPEFAIVDAAFDGDKSLRVAINGAGDNPWDIQAVGDSIEVVPGETYVYSVWARAETAGAIASFTVGNYAFAEYGRLDQQVLSDEWQEYTFEFTITDEESFIRAPIHFSYEANVGNAIYVDALTIVEAGAAGDAATVAFDDQTSRGLSVVVASVFVPEDGYVAIHDSTLLAGNALGSVIGVSEFLTAGSYEGLVVPLFDVPGLDVPVDTSLTENQTLIAMPHQETSGNMEYDFLTSEGAEDGPFFVGNDPNAGAVTDAAFITIELSGNLVTNGSFEQTEPGVITDLSGGIEGWILEVGGSVETDPEFAIVDDVAQEGDHSLRITVNGTGDNSYDIQAVADAIPVEPGETYVYSAWARAETAGAIASFTVGNYDFAEYGRLGDQVLSDEWQEYTFEFTITDEETVIRAPIHFSFEANVGNAIYIDNVSIEEVPPVGTESAGAPNEFVVEQNYPNPFSRTTTIEYELGVPSHVTLAVYNVLGQRVAVLIDQRQEAGRHEAEFDAAGLPSGVYFYRLEAADRVEAQQMMLVK